MGKNLWGDIWSNRRIEQTESTLLQHLIFLDGFDSGAGRIEEEHWVEYLGFIAGAVSIKAGDSLFEVGCGSGAFLYPFFMKGHVVGGIDYSQTLIAEARKAFPGMNFAVGEAANLNSLDQYDVVLSNGVFHYFPDLDYARGVVERMIGKARKRVAVLEVPDAAVERESEDARRGSLPRGEYDRKYLGLKHLYYDRQWFGDLASAHGCECSIFDQKIRDYGNNQFRFNCIFEKKT
jgi:SAM-dependent methyltransferase